MSSTIGVAVMVKTFDGNGYGNWEFGVKLLLAQNKVKSVLSKDPQ